MLLLPIKYRNHIPKGCLRIFMNSINNLPLSSTTSVEDYTTPIEAITLLQVVKTNSLICPVKKIFFSDPVQLNPCRHYLEKSVVINMTVCPLLLCGTPISNYIEVPLMRTMVNNVLLILSRPNEKLVGLLKEKSEAIKDSAEKQKLIQALEMFYMGGQGVPLGVKIVSELLPGNKEAKLYSPIFDLMNDHFINAKEKLDVLKTQTKLPTVRNNPPQPPMAPQQGKSSATSGSFFITATLPRPLNQSAPAMRSALGSQVRPIPILVPDVPPSRPIPNSSISNSSISSSSI